MYIAKKIENLSDRETAVVLGILYAEKEEAERRNSFKSTPYSQDLDKILTKLELNGLMDNEIMKRAEQLEAVTDFTYIELLEYYTDQGIFDINEHEVYQVLTEREVKALYDDIFAENIHQHSHYWVVTLK